MTYPNKFLSVRLTKALNVILRTVVRIFHSIKKFAIVIQIIVLISMRAFMSQPTQMFNSFNPKCVGLIDFQLFEEPLSE